MVSLELDTSCIRHLNLRLGEILCPDVIGPIENVSRLEATSSGNEREAVSPFSASTATSFQQFARMVVAGKPSHVTTGRASGKGGKDNLRYIGRL